ncbi:MAG TPA: hypothetical protein VFM99_05225 [Chitinophagales bacterium]|nr:hypothetical protein [Chitinophagales bacterium]
MNIENINTIAKEAIPLLDFSNREVLQSRDEIEYRKQLLIQSMVLGNTYHTKVVIIFESGNGIFQVDTTIWATTDDFVLLKGAVYLPIKCIHGVIIP